MLVYVFPTLLCNLKCDYCYIYNKDFYNKHNNSDLNISKKVVDTFLDKYVSYLHDKHIRTATLQFYGGEPLCNWEMVKYFIQKSKYMFPFEISIITNGTLVTDEMLDLFERYDVGIGMSVDGIKKVTDMHRRFKASSKSVYDEVVESIKKISSRKIRLALSVTITDELLRHQDDILENMVHLNVANINYNLLHEHAFNSRMLDYYSEATDFIIKSHNKLHSLKVNDDRISRKIGSFVNENFYYSDCKAFSANQIVLKPNGNVCVCQGEAEIGTSDIGNILIDSFDEISNNKKRLNWKNALPIFNELCVDCPYISICGGGCFLQAKEIKEFGGIDKPFCLHTEKLFIWLLDKLYNEIH